ncbi:MAG: cyclic pyranopterin monophosphate synthase MoaC [Thermosphaera sp.]
MVDISGKPESQQEAIATGFIKLKKTTVELIRSGKVEKGDVLDASIIAAILGVKKTTELLPLTHNIPISNVKVDFSIEEEGVRVYVTVKTTAKTGVEMEALAGATAALLNIWDMVKKYEKDENGQYPETVITDVRVISKVKKPLG